MSRSEEIGKAFAHFRAACTPQFKHDCDNCEFLGRHCHVDLYICGSDLALPTLIGRHSSVPEDYHSGYAGGMAGYAYPEIDEAGRRAMARGLL